VPNNPGPELAAAEVPPSRPAAGAADVVCAPPNNPGPELAGVEVPPNSPAAGAADVVCAPPNNDVEAGLDPKGLLGAALPLLGVGLKLNDMAGSLVGRAYWQRSIAPSL
jgi:hypothetical protein